MTTDVQYGLYYNSSSNRYDIYLDGSAKTNTGTNSVTKGIWNFVGFEWNGTNIKSYLNNTQKTTVNFSGTLTSQPYFNIGKRAGTTVNFKGLIGITLIAQCPARDIINWSVNNKMLNRYGISL
jgi:hypothetical protein